MDGKLVRKQKELADYQANYYEQKVLKIKMKIPQVNVDPLKILKRNFKRWIPDGGMPKFTLKSVTEKEVGEMICKLKNSHAYGTDKIDAVTIKMAASTINPSDHTCD